MGWQGLVIGKEGKPCCRMEVICDVNLRIWHVNSVMPGSKNDTTIMHKNCILNDVGNKHWPLLLPRFEVRGFLVQIY